MRNRSSLGAWLAVVLAAAAVIMAGPDEAQSSLVVNGGFEDDSQIFDPQPFRFWRFQSDPDDTRRPVTPRQHGRVEAAETA